MRSMKSAILFLALFVVASICSATTWVVGPTSSTPAPALPYAGYYGGSTGPQTMDICAAIEAASPGDTIQVDYNNGIPYTMTPWHNGNAGGTIDCWINKNNLTIIGINGRPIIDLTGRSIYKAPFDITAGNGGATGGENITFINLEIRGGASSHQSSTAAFRIESGTTGAPAGGNTLIEYCYLHDNGGDGVLANGVGAFDGNAYGVANPFITLLNDELANNGYGDYGYQHNLYIGADDSGQLVFNMYNTWTHDAVAGHTVKTRAPNNNIYYNMIGDAIGQTNTLIDMPFGGSTYIVGNSFYRVATNQNQNRGNVILYDYDGAAPGGYGSPAQSKPPYNYQDLHVVNNTFVIDPNYGTQAYVTLAAGSPIPLTTNAVIENNIFIGPAGLPITNQSTAILGTTALPNSNLVITNNSPGGVPTVSGVADVLTSGSAVSSMFADAAHFDFHLLPGATSAIGQGLAAPTLNDASTADPKAKAASEFLLPDNTVTRPNVSDLGAYSYPRVDTPPTANLSCTSSVTTPGTGTFTVTGLPTPTGGNYNTVTFISENLGVISDTSATSTTGTVTGSFNVIAPTNGSSSSFTVPADVYVAGEHLTCSVDVTPGPPTLVSITNDNGDGSGFSTTSVNVLNPPTTTSGPLTVTLSSSDQSILSVPAFVTIPVGAYTAETGSTTGSLWGQSPSTKTATITGVANGVTKTLSVVVGAPVIGGYCNMYPCSVVGGQTANIIIDSWNDWPTSGAPITCTSSNSALLPTQSFTLPGPSFYTGVSLNTNPVSTTTVLSSVSCTANGSGHEYGPMTLTPGVGVPVTITIFSGANQNVAFNTNFAQPLVAVVKDSAGNPVSGVTVNFTGSGVGFPGVLAGYPSTATTGANGQASTLAYPTQGGAVSVSANYQTGGGNYGSVPAVFNEIGNIITPTAIVATSGAGQTASLNTAFSMPLVATVTGAGNAPVAGAVVTFTGAGVSFPGGGVVVTNASGLASIPATPTTAGPLTVTASAAGGSGALTVTFAETAITAQAASVAYVSGNNQSVAVGSAFASPLVVIVKDAGGNPVPGTTVTFAFSGANTVSFANGGIAVSNSSGLASILATPNNVGALAITATVAGLPVVNFTETSTSNGPYLQSITWDGWWGDGSTVNLSAPATSPVIVTLSASNPSALYIPTSVTIPVGQTSAETGSEKGSAWGQNPNSIPVVVTAVANGVTVQLAGTITTLQVHNFWCNSTPCSTVSGNPVGFSIQTAFGRTPFSGMQMIVTSDNQAVIPNQSLTLSGAQNTPAINVSTNAGITNTPTVNVTFNFNGILMGPYPVIVSPGAVPTSVSVSSGSGQIATVGSNFANPLCAVVQGAGNVLLPGVVVTFSGSAVNFLWGQNLATTNGSGVACITAGPTALGSTPVVATVTGLSGPLTTMFTETGGTASPASVAVVSGSGQSASVGVSFTLPLVVVVKDSGGSAMSGVSVVFSGSGVTFPGGATVVTNGSGQASVIAQPSSVGALIVTASVAGVSTPATFSETGTSSGGGGGTSLAINAAGGAVGSFVADEYFSGGSTSSFSDAIDLSKVVSPAPQAVYQSQRYGNSTYTIPGLTSGSNYLVRLHFAEVYWGNAGQRVFNVVINGAQVLTNYDMVAKTGGKDIADIESFSATADTNGQITIQFVSVRDNAGINGIEILSSGYVAVVSGDGQSANMGTAFTNPLVVVVKDSGGNPQSGVSVTYAYTLGNGTFSGGGVVVTGLNGQGSVTATPTSPGPITISATVTGLAAANFSETGLSAAPYLVSVTPTPACCTDAGTDVNLSAPAPVGGALVTLVSSNPSVLWVPASVVIPAGQSTVSTGSLLGTAWGQSPQSQVATVTATYLGVNQSLTSSHTTSQIHNLWCDTSNCTVAGGNPVSFVLQTAFNAVPENGGLMTVTSDTPSIIPNQAVPLPAGQGGYLGFGISTLSGHATKVVNLTLNYNGLVNGPYPVTVTGNATPASLAIVSGSNQRAAVGTNAANPLVVIVKDTDGNPLSGITVSFASGANVTLSSLTAITDASGMASVTALPTAQGTLVITATVAGVALPVRFNLVGLQVLTWPAPAPIVYGTNLAGVLNATVNVPGTFAYATSTGTPITTATILPAGTTGLNVLFTPQNGTAVIKGGVRLIVVKAPLTVTGQDATAMYMSQFPTYTYTVSGFVNGDTASVVTGAPSLTTSATIRATLTRGLVILTSPVGTYSIDAHWGNLKATNYTFVFAPGTLTITPTTNPLTITARNVTVAKASLIPSTFSYTVTGLAGFDTVATAGTGTPSVTTTATSSSAAGSYPITAAAGTFAAPNYTTVNYVNGTLIIK